METPSSKYVFRNLLQPGDEIWETIYLIPFASTNETFLRSFQYRLLNNILPTQEKLKHYKISRTSECQKCGHEKEDLSHLFVKCPTVIQFWKDFEIFWRELTEMHIRLNTIDILLGITRDIYKSELLNYLLILAKHMILSSTINEYQLHFVNFEKKVKQNCNMELNFAKRNNNITKFEAKWGIYMAKMM